MMRLATVQAFKAFVSQVRENVFEAAKKTVERRGCRVVEPTGKKEAK
jgi:hypothetical protein